jgi:hypothetical protein
MFKRLAFASAAIVLQACASAPDSAYVNITYSEQMFSAADWTTDLDKAARAAGWGDRIPEMQARLNESGSWPAKMKDGDARWFEKDTIRKYNVREIARLSYYDQPAVLVVVPASANQHMPEGWKPAEDFFIVIGELGLP